MGIFKKLISSLLVLGLVLSMSMDSRVYALDNNELDVDIITDDTDNKDEDKYEYEVVEDENGNFNIVRNLNGEQNKILKENVGHWTSLDGIDEYTVSFCNIVVVGDDLYYNTPSQIRKINLKSVDSELEDKAVLTIDTNDGFIFGIRYDEESQLIQYVIKADRQDDDNYVDFIELEDINVDSVELTLAETKAINIELVPTNATKQKITYKSSNESIVTVDEDGMMKGIGEGEAQITVTMGNGIEKTFDVTVKRVELLGVSIPESQSIYLDDTDQKIEITTDPKEGTIIDNIQWIVENEEIASINEDGTIVPNAVGETTVKVLADGKESNEMKLVVLPLYYDSITVKDMTMNIGDTQKIEITSEPEDVKYKDFTYDSLDETIATVDEDGNVTGVSDGETTITITDNHNINDTIKVTVHRVGLTGVKIPESLTIYEDDEGQELKYETDPEDATIEGVEWVIEDEKIISIEDGVIKPLTAGSTTVKVIISDGKNDIESNVMTVTVLPLYYDSVTVNKDLTVNVGETKKIEVVTDPTKVKYDEITYESKDTDVATVDKDGHVKGIKAGTTIVTVTYKGEDKDITKEVKVTVKKVPVSEVTLNKTSLKLEYGKTYTLKATVSPTNATVKKATWSTSSKSIVSVTSAGKITAKKIGTATITATVDGKKAQCKVTVTPALTLSNSSKTININQSFTLKATTKYSSGVTSKSVKYSSSKSSVASVNSKGKVTGKKAGTATITVKVSCKVNKVTYTTTKTCKVTVKSVAVKSVKLNRKSASLTYGSSLQLKATVSPSNASNKKLKWSSSKSSVASVSSSGKVTAKKVGSATITVKTSNGKKATCKITVTRKSISGARVSYQSSYTYTGKSIRPSVSVRVGSKTLRKGTDYTVSYGTNKKTKGTIRITGKGNYSGTITKTFTIKEKKVKMSAPSVSAINGGFKVSYSRGKNASGYQIAYSTSRSSGFKVVSTRSLSKTISGLKRKKTYYVKVRFYKTQGGKKVYSQYSSIRSVKTK